MSERGEEHAVLTALSTYQHQMNEITGRAERNLIEGGPRARAELERDRASMARLMASYQLFVHREILEPIIAAGQSPDVENARMLKSECVALAADFLRYTKEWQGRDLSAEWAEYAPLARRMIERIRGHARNVRRLAPPLIVSRARLAQ